MDVSNIASKGQLLLALGSCKGRMGTQIRVGLGRRGCVPWQTAATIPSYALTGSGHVAPLLG